MEKELAPSIPRIDLVLQYFQEWCTHFGEKIKKKKKDRDREREKVIEKGLHKLSEGTQGSTCTESSQSNVIVTLTLWINHSKILQGAKKPLSTVTT